MQHLLCELARIDALIRREVMRWQSVGQNPNDDFRGLRITDDDAVALSARPFGVSWGQIARLDSKIEDGFTRSLAEAERKIVAASDAARLAGDMPRLERLEATFGLDRFDLDVLLIALAPALDNRYERLYGYLQDDITRRRPSVNLALDLLCGPDADRLRRLPRFADDAPLFAHRLLERIPDSANAKPSPLNYILLPDESIIAWLLGDYRSHPALRAQARLLPPVATATDRLLAMSAWPDIERAAAQPGHWPLLVFHGVNEAGQEAAARQLAAAIHRPLLHVNLPGAINSESSPLIVLNIALRDARLTGAIPFFTGWDSCLADGAPPPTLLAALCAHPDLAIVAGRAGWQARGLARDRQILWIEFAIPDYPHRAELWKHFLGDAPSTDSAVAALASQFYLTAEQIRDSVASAKDRAAQHGSALGPDDLFYAARAHSNPAFNSPWTSLFPTKPTASKFGRLSSRPTCRARPM
ncbi:MAG: hypothetical protein FJ030_10965 [Chloroflexi bacterium]|nr:hypothetical protein [Chloroflexota bacterium]